MPNKNLLKEINFLAHAKGVDSWIRDRLRELHREARRNHDEIERMRVFVVKIAGIQLWRDVYPDGLDGWETHLNAHITVADVHAARALLGIKTEGHSR